MEFGEKLQMLRKARGWSQEELAQQINVSRQALSKWESGASIADTENVIALSRLFGVSTDYLVSEDASVSAGSDDELSVYLEELRTRPEMRMLFSLAQGATKEDVERAVAIIEALRKGNNG